MSGTDFRQAPFRSLALGPVDVLVNCAGIAPPAKVLDRDGTPAVLADFERIVRINLVGTFNVISQAAAVIGDVQVRNRGTIGGSSAHADPAADYPVALTAAGA